MDTYNIYKDIQARTGGEIYIGVVGPVRTGKSTFVRRFMELAALPNMEENLQKRDPGSASAQRFRKTHYDRGTEIYSERGGKDSNRGRSECKNPSD